jgi:hypothetical protein
MAAIVEMAPMARCVPPTISAMPETWTGAADASTFAEASASVRVLHPLDSLRGGGSDALAAALIGSEANKNARLRQVLTAYELCRTKMR